MPDDIDDFEIGNAHALTFPSVRHKGEPLTPPRQSHLAYQDASFLLLNGRAADVIIVRAGAATNQDVAVGDSLGDAQTAYPDSRCGELNVEGIPSFPFCAGRVAAERYIWFGGDPINTIELNRYDFPKQPVEPYDP